MKNETVGHLVRSRAACRGKYGSQTLSVPAGVRFLSILVTVTMEGQYETNKRLRHPILWDLVLADVKVSIPRVGLLLQDDGRLVQEIVLSER